MFSRFDIDLKHFFYIYINQVSGQLMRKTYQYISPSVIDVFFSALKLGILFSSSVFNQEGSSFVLSGL